MTLDLKSLHPLVQWQKENMQSRGTAGPSMTFPPSLFFFFLFFSSQQTRRGSICKQARAMRRAATWSRDRSFLLPLQLLFACSGRSRWPLHERLESFPGVQQPPASSARFRDTWRRKCVVCLVGRALTPTKMVLSLLQSAAMSSLCWLISP